MAEVLADHRKGPRRRGEALEQAVFEAALAELSEAGYAGAADGADRGTRAHRQGLVEVVDEVLLPLVQV